MSDEMPQGIYAALAAVNREVDAITKDQKNKAQGFMFRGIDSVYNNLHDILARHGVFTTPRVLEAQYEERQTARGGALFVTRLKVEYDFICEDGSQIVVGPVIGEAMDSGDKGANKALAVAHKYALFQTFTIPTMFSDPDADTHSVKPKDPLATEEQRSEIHDLKDYINKRNQVWLRNNWDRMTYKHAESILEDAKKLYAADQQPTVQENETGLDIDESTGEVS